jgi:hypothetical protein
MKGVYWGVENLSKTIALFTMLLVGYVLSLVT